MRHDYDILLFGSYFCDLIFTGLPEMPRLGAEIFGRDVAVVPGAAFTTALACHRLGVRVGWSCDFGSDFFSRFVLDAAREAGLPDELFRVHPFPVRRVTVSLSFPHDRSFVSVVDGVAPVSPADLVMRHRPRAVLLSHLEYGEAQRALVEAAREVGALMYMDCQHSGATLETPGVADALQQVDMFAPNETEALQLTGAETLDEALERLAALTPLVIVKRGERGAVARAAGRTMSMPALPVDVVDTTGAGDCFNAGFLFAHLAGRPLEQCLRAGNICGGLSAAAYGGAGLPDRAQLEDMLGV